MNDTQQEQSVSDAVSARRNCASTKPSDVDEARTLGVPLELSEIGVHRKQAEGRASVSDPGSPAAAAEAMLAAWQRVGGPDTNERLRHAGRETELRVREFAHAFGRAVARTAAGSP